MSYRVEIGPVGPPNYRSLEEHPDLGEWLGERTGWTHVRMHRTDKVSKVKDTWVFLRGKSSEYFEFEDEHEALEFKLRFG